MIIRNLLHRMLHLPRSESGWMSALHTSFRTSSRYAVPAADGFQNNFVPFLGQSHTKTYLPSRFSVWLHSSDCPVLLHMGFRSQYLPHGQRFSMLRCPLERPANPAVANVPLVYITQEVCTAGCGNCSTDGGSNMVIARCNIGYQRP